jgi:hypothetical protein
VFLSSDAIAIQFSTEMMTGINLINGEEIRSFSARNMASIETTSSANGEKAANLQCAETNIIETGESGDAKQYKVGDVIPA